MLRTVGLKLAGRRLPSTAGNATTVGLRFASEGKRRRKDMLPNAKALWPTEDSAILSHIHGTGNVRVGSLSIAVEPVSEGVPHQEPTSAPRRTGEGFFASRGGATIVDTPQPISVEDFDAAILEVSARTAESVPGGTATSRVARYSETTMHRGLGGQGAAGPSISSQGAAAASAASAAEGAEGVAADLSEEPGQVAGARAARDSYQGALEGSAKQQAATSKRDGEGERMGAAYVRPQSQGAGARRGLHTSAQVSMRAAAPLHVRTGPGWPKPDLYGPPPVSDPGALQYERVPAVPEWQRLAAPPQRSVEAVLRALQGGGGAGGSADAGAPQGGYESATGARATDATGAQSSSGSGSGKGSAMPPTGNPNFSAMPGSLPGTAKAAVYQDMGRTYSYTDEAHRQRGGAPEDAEALTEPADTGATGLPTAANGRNPANAPFLARAAAVSAGRDGASASGSAAMSGAGYKEEGGHGVPGRGMESRAPGPGARNSTK